MIIANIGCVFIGNEPEVNVIRVEDTPQYRLSEIIAANIPNPNTFVVKTDTPERRR